MTTSKYHGKIDKVIGVPIKIEIWKLLFYQANHFDKQVLSCQAIFLAMPVANAIHIDDIIEQLWIIG